MLVVRVVLHVGHAVRQCATEQSVPLRPDLLPELREQPSGLVAVAALTELDAVPDPGHHLVGLRHGAPRGHRGYSGRQGTHPRFRGRSNAGPTEQDVDDTQFVRDTRGHHTPGGAMTTAASTTEATNADTPKPIVKVSAAMIEAARAQVAISKQLGRPVSKVVEKIAAVR